MTDTALDLCRQQLALSESTEIQRLKAQQEADEAQTSGYGYFRGYLGDSGLCQVELPDGGLVVGRLITARQTPIGGKVAVSRSAGQRFVDVDALN